MSEDRWRKVSEEMPSPFEWVWTWGGEYGAEAHSSPSGVFYAIDGAVIPVTHWRPLPAPPEED